MKKSVFRLAFAILLISLVTIIGSVVVFADEIYTPIGGSYTIINNLVVNEDNNIPDITFECTITSVPTFNESAVPATIVESPIAASIENVSFSNLDITYPGLPTDPQEGPYTSGIKYARKAMAITFPDGSFTLPGTYRYLIDEVAGSHSGVTYDTTPRFLDVVVTGENNGLTIDSFTLRNEEDLMYQDGSGIDASSVGSVGLINSINQHDFTFSKSVVGNQISKNTLFTFFLTIEKAIPGVYSLQASSVPDNTPHTITVDSNGCYAGKFDLMDGSTIQIIGLNDGATCTISEDTRGYLATFTIDNNPVINSYKPNTITMNADHTISFTNTKNTVIADGILMSVAPFTAIMLLFGIGLIAVVSRLKSD